MDNITQYPEELWGVFNDFKCGVFSLCFHSISYSVGKCCRKKTKQAGWHSEMFARTHICELQKITVRDTQYCCASWATLILWSLRWMLVFRDVLLAFLTNSWLHSWLSLTALCQHLLCQVHVNLYLKWTKLEAENTCLKVQFGTFNCAAKHTGHAPQVCFLSNLLLCKQLFTWKSALCENIQISLLQRIYRPCLA